MAAEFFKSLVVIFAVAVQSSSATASTMELPSGRLMRGPEFCSRLTNTVEAAFFQNGSSRRESKKFASDIAFAFIDDVKAGRLNPYMMSASSHQISGSSQRPTWFSTPDLILSAVGFQSDRVMLLDSVNDLRFVPHMMPKSHLVIFAADAGELNSSRQEMIIATTNHYASAFLSMGSR